MSFIRKTINATKSFEIEIEITQNDIINYIKNSGANSYELKEIIDISNKNMLDTEEGYFKIETLNDELKVKLLSQAYKKYTLIQLENLLKY